MEFHKHRFNFFLRLILTLAFSTASVFGSAQEDLPFRINRISDRVFIFSPGLYAPTAATSVIVTDEGLILVDTGLSPTLAEMTRRKIKKELGRDDVIQIINTHHHPDHTNGNQVYTGAEILGHAKCATEMERFVQKAASDVESQKGRMDQLRAELESAAPGSEVALRVAETIKIDEIFLKDLQSKLKATPPTITTSDKRTTLTADLKIHLYAFGTAHTNSDILVHVPALQVLFVGDLFHPDYLSVTARNDATAAPRWIEVLDTVLAQPETVKTIIGGHGHIFSPEWLKAQADYTKGLWTEVKMARESGTALQNFLGAHPLKIYASMANYFDLTSAANLSRHGQIIRSFWNVGLASAAVEIETLLETQTIETARIRFSKIWRELNHEFFIDEREFNALGYQLLQHGKIEAAIAVFAMNTAAFPQSWNVWDSLAEAYLYSGNNAESEKYYRKSLELNPESPSGRAAVSRFDGYRLDDENQTKAAAIYEEGEQTGLKEPYFGQKPPGTRPEVFAPGIVSFSGNFEFSISFNPDGHEVYFTRRKEDGGNNTIMVSRLKEEGWTAPEEAAFPEGFPSNEPSITPGGKILYYGSNRPQPGSQNTAYGIWKTQRSGDEWGKPEFHGPGMYVSSDSTGDLYMTDISGAVEGGGLIRYPFKNGRYGKPERLPPSVNAPTEVAHGYIAPDGSFLLFDTSNRPGGQGGEGDLYVCFRNPDGSWGEAQNLGDEVNSPGTNFCPSLSPDGKYLFFSMYKDIYWVSTEVIHRLAEK